MWSLPGPACHGVPRGVPQGHGGGDRSSGHFKGISAQQSMAWVPTLQHPNTCQGNVALGCSGWGRDHLWGRGAAEGGLRLGWREQREK